MRTAFINTLIDRAHKNSKLFLLVGDLGYSVVEPFAAAFPDRFLNVGVAEQNMVGIAAGLAAEGFHVFTYSIANFATLRCLEQIRNDVCYPNRSVTIVAVGAGLAYGSLGYSHHAIHDIAALRGLPNLAVVCPADPLETVAAVDYVIGRGGPSYLRVGKAGEPLLTGIAGSIDHPTQVCCGQAPVALCATGSILAVAIAASEILRSGGVRPSVFSVPLLTPLSQSALAGIWSHRNIVTIEEHVQAGGFGSMVREIAPDSCRVRSLFVQRDSKNLVGNQDFLRKTLGLIPEEMARLAFALISTEQ